MKISIITPSYNQGCFIEQNIQSVLQQDHADVEHIVVDGGSKDNTVDVLKSYSHLRWVSEKDEGQTDALNKGIAMATGDIIGWINSDDYYEPNIFAEVLSHFADPKVQWIVGDLTVHYEWNRPERVRKSPAISYLALLKNPDIVRQPGTFFRKSFLEAAGPFDKSLQLVMDFEMWLRLSRMVPPKMIGKNFAYFRIHEQQKTAGSHLIKQLREMKKVLSQYPDGLSHFQCIRLKKYWTYAKIMAKEKIAKWR